MMDAEQAAKIMYAKEIEGAEDAVALIQEKAGEYASLQSQRSFRRQERLCG